MTIGNLTPPHLPMLRRTALFLPLALAATVTLSGACDERAPLDLGRTPPGPGAKVRFDLANTPLPDIPLPNDTATWSDPTSRTGLRINASLIAPTDIERNARERFDQLEGWGTFMPLSVAFDLEGDRAATDAALDLANISARHRGDDYDFADDAVYLINLDTGVPVPLDLGAGNFQYTLKRLDRYWANDPRASERNIAFETIDETRRGAITPADFTAELDGDFDGVLDVPNLDEPFACPDPDPECDRAGSPTYEDPACYDLRRARDRCIADHLLTFYERETDTLVMRPLLPLHEATKYAVVITDRVLDSNGDSVKSPFDHVYHAAQRTVAERVQGAIDAGERAAYFGDLAGTGLDHVAFTWGFTTQPTVDDLKLLRDGLYGKGPFSRFASEFPPELEVRRMIGPATGLEQGAVDPVGWESTDACKNLVGDLYIVKFEDIRETLKFTIEEIFGEGDGAQTQALLRSFDSIDYMVLGTFRSPFLLEGGPLNADPKAAFNLDYVTGEGESTSDTVPFWLIVPKATAKHQQPFDVNIYGHGYTGNFLEHIFYSGNLAQHGLATIGINAMGHGLDLGDEGTKTLAKGIFSGGCAGPALDALQLTRARDLDKDGIPDSGGDFWSSYLFHTRDSVRQSVLDHIQLVRIMRAFGTTGGRMRCQNETTGWVGAATEECDVDADGQLEVAGDFDGDGVADVGGPNAKYGTWGESLGGILSGIHGAIDAYVTSASPGSGGGGLTDIGVRSFQGGVVEAVLLRLWGPLLVTIPIKEAGAQRPACTGGLDDKKDCTMCVPGEVSLRWVMPDTNSTGELEIDCLTPTEIQDTTVLVYNLDNDELRCASVGDTLQMRLGIPSTVGDEILVSFFSGAHGVTDYETCRPTFPEGTIARTEISEYGRGRVLQGQTNPTGTDTCASATCNVFQGTYFGEGTPLTAPAEGLGQVRQTPSLRRFLMLAQMALEPGDPISFAPYYAIKPMTDPFGALIEPHAVLTVNTIGDMNVPLNSGIAFARATGAVPFFRPDQAARYPEYIDYVTPAGLFDALGGKTPNQDLIDRHVIEGVTALARHPAAPACELSANAILDGTYLDSEGVEKVCFPTGCATDPDVCLGGSECDVAQDLCVPRILGLKKCEEALFDADDLDEGTALYYEQAANVPHRLVRYTQSASASSVEDVWTPRLAGVPYGADLAWQPDSSKRVTGLLDAYVVPSGVHTFVNGNPCENFDAGSYLTNLVSRFFQTDGTDVYYLSHPSTHLCLGTDVHACGYLE